MSPKQLKAKYPNRGYVADSGYVVDSDYVCSDCIDESDIQSAYSLDYEETDAPCHCCECQALIVTNLTDYGMQYVREKYRESKNVITKLWRNEFSYAWNSRS